MSKKWYALAALGSFALGGVLGVVGGSHNGFKKGYEEGYNNSEPEYVVRDFNEDGDEDLCVALNATEVLCSIDYNRDGAQDLVKGDIEGNIHGVRYGKKVCLTPEMVQEIIKDPSLLENMSELEKLLQPKGQEL
ncbi:MAG: hypothetical protein Q7S55_04665 [Nanoarchaeota archaeon]|nr:hypothetical protein [Nanoarchaeota archaeon]